MRSIRSFTRLPLAIAVQLSCASAVIAANQTGSLALEEVTVTAQKTEQSLQDVPVTVNAISGEDFKDAAGFAFQDIGRFTPGLDMYSVGTQQDITLRGVGSRLDAVAHSRVTANLDGSYVRMQQMVFMSQFDIERFEVLRGPQGTLYGKASPVGAVVIHTKNPSMDTVEGDISVTSGEYGLTRTEFGLSVPIINDELSIRLAGIYEENDSQDIKYLNTAEQMARTSGGRATVLWQPTDSFEARLSHTYIESTPNISSQVEGHGIKASDRISVIDQQRVTKMDANTTVLALNMDMGWAELISQSFYAEAKNYDLYDKDYSDIDETVLSTDTNYSTLLNQDIRLQSLGNDNWDWMFGLYYEKGSSENQVKVTDNNVLIPDYLVTGLYLPGSLTTDLNIDIPLYENFGVYTHNTFYLSDDWTLTAGLRWTKENNAFKSQSDIEIDVMGNVTTISNPELSLPSDYYDLTGTLKLQYQIDRDNMVFATVDRGGRGGGGVLDLTGLVPYENLSYDDESSNSIELGYKGTFRDGAMSVSASIYRNVIKNYQLDAVDIQIKSPIDGSVGLATFQNNAKKVIAEGAEIELRSRMTENWTLSTSLAYNDTKFDDFADAPCNVGDGSSLAVGEFATCDRSGERVGGDSSLWSAVVSSDYSIPVDALNSNWYFNFLYKYDSERNNFANDGKTPGFGTLDVFTGLRSFDENWDIKLWVKNVLDKEAVIQRGNPTLVTNMGNAFTPINPSVSNEMSSGYTPITRYSNPRQVGVTLSYHF